MPLYFPNLDTLRLALTSGVVPSTVSLAPVVASFGAEGQVWVKPSAALPRAAQAELRRLGVQTVKNGGSEVVAELSCWPQLLPLQRDESLLHPSAQTPVLFELPRAELLPALVGEILRLGNDRQGFRSLRREDDRAVLLRVVGPPYYSLLRALERDGQASPLHAYVERSPRVWVEIGHNHPLIAQVHQPEGKLLLLRPPRDWTTLDEGPFRDIYEVLEFKLPTGKSPWGEAAGQERLTVPLRLAPGGGGEAAELWVLRDNGLEQVDELVRHADDLLLSRLAFAVGEAGGQQVVVLRVRPSRQTPPVLVLQGQSFRSYLKLPNLFLPCGQRLQPPLRRDAVRKLLAEDAEQITWLYPHADHTFTPESLPDSAFRPLPEWIDYVLDHDRAALQAWVQSTQFDFERFICKDEDAPAKPKQKSPRESHGDRKGSPTSGGSAASGVSASKEAAADDLLDALPRAEPNELQKRLHALETQFLAVEGPLDAPQRQELWPQLAVLNTALKHGNDAMLCWLNALWEDHPQAATWARTWARSELGTALETELQRLLARQQPSSAEVRALAAGVVWAALQERAAPVVLRRLNELRQYLQEHEELLPVRAVWLAWLALCKLSHGDVLALARTRDRLLERLFKQGLLAEQDLPSFLRFNGVRGSDRFRAFRDWLVPLPGHIGRWIHSICPRPLVSDNRALTEAYANLMLAFGLARLGEGNECRRLHDRARQVLAQGDDVHTFLLGAFGHRIEQLLQGKPPTGPWPPELLEYREHISDPRLRFNLDRLREVSRILEPHEKINAYQLFIPRYHDPLVQTLNALSDLTDRAQLEQRIAQLFHQHEGKSDLTRLRQAQILGVALELAPRVGEAFALPLLEKVDETIETLEQPTPLEKFRQQAGLLERALFVAAHFDQVTHVQALVRHFHRLLQSQGGPSGLQVLNSLAGQCFRGLRKLGMREEIQGLLQDLAAAIMQGQGLATLRTNTSWPAMLSALQQVAAGLYYFGKDDQAKLFLDEARALLYRGSLTYMEQTNLACSYIVALGQAPVEAAFRGIEEVFQKLGRVQDPFTTGTHYSLVQLRVVEAVVLSVVSEDFALGSTSRRWLDDEEFLVRRRIHHDLHAVLEK